MLGRGVDAFQPVVQQGLEAGVVQAQQAPTGAAASHACWQCRPAAASRRPCGPAAHRRQRRAPCPGGPLRAHPCARAAQPPARFPSPVSMCSLVHRPCRPSSPCLASQGLSLPSVCTFSCRARSASRRADQIGLAAELGVAVCLSVRPGLRPAPAPARPAHAGAHRPVRVARRPRRCIFSSDSSLRSVSGAARPARSVARRSRRVRKLCATAHRCCGSRRPAPGSAAAPA